MAVRFGETAWHTDSADSGQIRCDGEDIGKIHLQRICGAFAQLECRHRRRGRNQRIDFLEGLREILPDQLPHFLRTQIIGVVIAGTQNVGPENNRRFTSGPKPSSRVRP